MGNLVSSAGPRAAVVGIDSYVGELPEVVYEKSLGGARFLKTIRCRHPEGLVVVKIFVKPEPGLSLKPYIKAMQSERDLLNGLPNILTNYLVTETERAGYIVRQYVASNLYDRISNRPFLTSFEKQWIAFQLLAATVEAHSRQIYHGDIKTENVFVTSWNWIYLSDFSSFKPTMLPEDNPADFTFFFDTSARRTCYLAPERFHGSNDGASEDRDARLTPEMDIFALGCTIGELFLEGTPVFTLSHLLRFRKGKYDPALVLDRIENADIRALVKHMTQLDPTARLTAQQYLSKWRNKAFPEYFYTFMHHYVASLSDPYHAASSPQYHVFLANSTTAVTADADAKIDRIYFDFAHIAEALEIPNPLRSNTPRTSVLGSSTDGLSLQLKKKAKAPFVTSDDSSSGTSSLPTLPKTSLPVHVHIPGFPSNVLDTGKSTRAADGCLILIAVVCASIRNTLYPTSRLRGIDLLLVMSIQVSDEHKLDRIVPFFVTLLTDESPAVRTNSLTALTQLLATVKSIVASDRSIFPEYILPSVKRFTSDPDNLARAAYAQCIAVLAELSLQFLELSQLFKSSSQIELDMDTNLYQISYDASLRDIQDTIQEDVVALLIDPHPIVKQSLLIDMPRLCIFFGRQKANDVLLSHMITYLNDSDSMLRNAFCEAIVGVGTFMGMQSLEEYILPLMVQALTDSEEFVVEKVLNSLTSLAELGLMTKNKVHELSATVLPLVCHPNRWIRFGAVAFLASAARLVPLIDVRCVLYPMVRPFLRQNMPGFSEVHLLENLKAPVSRQLYEQMILFVAKDNAVSGNYGSGNSFTNSNNASSNSNDRAEPLDRLKNFVMADEDKEKLFAMKYFISKASSARFRKHMLVSGNTGVCGLGSDRMHVALRDHGVTLHTVFLTPPVNRARKDNAGMVPNLRQLGLGVGASGSAIKNEKNADRTLLTESVSSIGSDDRKSPSAFTGDTDARMVSRRMIVRTRSETNLSSGMKRSSKNSSVGGNHDLTVESPLPHSAGDRHTRRSSGRSRLVDSVESATAADGQEKHIRKVLEKKAKELFLPQFPELGLKVTFEGRTALIDARLRRVRTSGPTPSELRGWRPQGILVAHFTEHVAQVNAVCVAPDHRFFATCSDDGTVKIWDTNRLHTNVANRARLTYSGMGDARVKAIAFCEHRHSIASAGDDGQVHISRVEYVIPQSGSVKYTGCMPVRAFTVSQGGSGGNGEYVTQVCHTETDMQSLLVYTTTRGRLCALDLRSMRQVWSFQVLPRFGTITALVLDRKCTWALVGTHRGVLCLWDIRFQLCTKVWAHPSRACIHKLSLYPHRSNSRAGMNASGRLVAMAVGTPSGEVSVWNIATGECAEVFCTMSDGTSSATLGATGAAGVCVASGGSSSGSAAATSSGISSSLSSTSAAGASASLSTAAAASGRVLIDLNTELCRIYGDGPRAVAPPAVDDLVDDTSSFSLYKLPKSGAIRTFAFEPEGPFMVTGGSDRRLRFWDLNRIDKSMVVSGIEEDSTMGFKYSSQLRGETNFHVETRVHQHFVGGAATSDTGRLGVRGVSCLDLSEDSGGVGMASGGGIGNAGGIGGGGGSSSSGNHTSHGIGSASDNTIATTGRASWLSDRMIAGKGAELVTSAVPRRHLDGITDLAITRLPHPMIITGGRDGVVKVWQ